MEQRAGREMNGSIRERETTAFANLQFALRFGSSTLACSQTFSLLSASGLRPSLESNSGGVRLSVEARVKEPRISPNELCSFEAARKPLACTPPRILAFAKFHFALRFGSSTLA